MSTSFAIWPSERFEVRSMAESTFLLPLLNQRNFSLLDLLIVKCCKISS